MVIVACPTCSTQYRVDAQRLRGGKGRLRCARCKTVFPVESAGAEAPGTGPGAPAATGPAPRQASVAAPPDRPRLEIALLAFEPGPVQKRFLGVLQSLKLRVALSDDGPNALDVARRSRPRLLVTAHWLPDLSGPELLAGVREEPALAGTRTLLVGSPAPRLRSPASPAAIHGADAHVPAEAREAEIEAVVRALLGMPGGRLAGPPEDELRAHARVAVADLRLYHEAEIDAGRRAGRLSPRVADYLARARSGCIERFPEALSLPASLEAWDDEVRKSLRRHD